MKTGSVWGATIPVAIALLGTTFVHVPKHPTSQIRNVPDRLEAKVSWGTAPEIFDTLTARTCAGEPDRLR